MGIKVQKTMFSRTPSMFDNMTLPAEDNELQKPPADTSTNKKSWLEPAALSLMAEGIPAHHENDSKYIKARLLSFHSDNTMANRQNAILGAA